MRGRPVSILKRLAEWRRIWQLIVLTCCRGISGWSRSLTQMGETEYKGYTRAVFLSLQVALSGHTLQGTRDRIRISGNHYNIT
jgi:hypothetical protein